MYRKITLETMHKIQSAVSPAEAAAVEQVFCKAAFDSVANKEDWRAPVDAAIPQHGHFSDEFVAYAVEYFTATKPTITWENGRGSVIKANGYRNGPAGP